MDALTIEHAISFQSTTIAPFDEQAGVWGFHLHTDNNLKLHRFVLCGISSTEICCTQNLVTSDTAAHMSHGCVRAGEFMLHVQSCAHCQVDFWRTFNWHKLLCDCFFLCLQETLQYWCSTLRWQQSNQDRVPAMTHILECMKLNHYLVHSEPQLLKPSIPRRALDFIAEWLLLIESATSGTGPLQ